MKTKKELTEELVLRIQELLKQFDNSNISKDHYYLIEVCEVFDEIKISTPGNYFTAVFIDALHQAIVTKHICFNFRANKFFTGIVISLGYYHIEKEFS
jgi:hypothetical protein